MGASRLNPAMSQFNPAMSQFNPAMSQLNPAMSQLNPVMSQVNPAMSQFNPAMSQLNPAMYQLNPAMSPANSGISQPNLTMSQPNPASMELEKNHDALTEFDNHESTKSYKRFVMPEFDDDNEGFRKRIRTTDQLTFEQEQELVDWFTVNPIFYDQTHPEFKNRAKRDRMMDKKASELGIRGILIWTWFKSMRTIYAKLKKRKIGKPMTPRQNWMITSFQFLETHLTVRGENRQQGYHVPEVHIDTDVDDKVHDEDSDSDEVTVYSTQRPSTRQQGLYGKANNRQTDSYSKAADAMTTETSKQEEMQTSVRISNNERDAFSNWIGLETGRFNENLWNKYMADAFALVMRYKQQNTQASLQNQNSGMRPLT